MPGASTPDIAPVQPGLKEAVRGVVGEKRGGTPSEQRRIVKVSDLLAQSRAREALSVVATRFEHQDTWEKTAKMHVVTKFDANGDRNPQGQEQTDLAQVKRTLELYSKYLQKGWDGVLKSGPNGYHDFQELERQVQIALLSDSDLTEKLSYETPTGRKVRVDTVKRIMEDRHQRDLLAKVLNVALDPSKVPNESDLLLSRGKFNQLDLEVRQLTGRKSSLETSATSLRQEQSAFDTDATKGVKLKELETDIEITNYKRAQADYNSAYEFARSGGKIGTQELTRARAMLESMRTDKVKDWEALGLQKKGIDDKARQTESELNKTTSELTLKQDQRTESKQAMDRLTHQREAAAKHFKHEIENALLISIRQRVLEDAQRAIGEFPEYEASLQANLKTELDEKMREHLQTRYIKQKTVEVGGVRIGKLALGVRSEELLVTDKDGINADMAQIFGLDNARPAAPDEFVKRVFKDAGMNDSQIATLAENKEVMRTWRSELVRDAITAYKAEGGKMTDKMLNTLDMTPWGRELMNQSINQNPEAKQKIETITGKPFTENSVHEAVQLADNPKTKNHKHLKKSLLGILFAVLVKEMYSSFSSDIVSSRTAA